MQLNDSQTQEKLNKEVRTLFKTVDKKRLPFFSSAISTDHLTFDDFLSDKMLLVFFYKRGFALFVF